MRNFNRASSLTTSNYYSEGYSHSNMAKGKSRMKVTLDRDHLIDVKGKKNDCKVKRGQIKLKPSKLKLKSNKSSGGLVRKHKIQTEDSKGIDDSRTLNEEITMRRDSSVSSLVKCKGIKVCSSRKRIETSKSINQGCSNKSSVQKQKKLLVTKAHIPVREIKQFSVNKLGLKTVS